MTALVGNLGGTAGFGEFSLPANDDGSTGFIDLTPIFGTQGINYFGRYYTGFYLNNNGSVTFNTASSSFTPSSITGSTSNPIIAAYWTDIDTRGGAVAPTPGGTSTGTNLLWYDLDSVTKTFTATWDDVGYFSSQTNKLNAFQLSIQQINAEGDFDITFRYENVDWTTGNASGGSNGLGGTPARAGYSAGNGVEYFELPQSGNQANLLALESASNVGAPGTFVFSVRNGTPTVGVTAGDASIDEGDGGDPAYVSIPVFLTEASTSTVTVQYTTANGSALAGQDYVAQSGTLTFAPGVMQQNILVAVAGDTIVEADETFTVTLSDPSEGASILDGSATGAIVNDDFMPASLSIAATSADKPEGQSGSSLFTFTVTRTGDLRGAASAQWAVTGPAVNAADFTGGRGADRHRELRRRREFEGHQHRCRRRHRRRGERGLLGDAVQSRRRRHPRHRLGQRHHSQRRCLSVDRRHRRRQTRRRSGRHALHLHRHPRGRPERRRQRKLGRIRDRRLRFRFHPVR